MAKAKSTSKRSATKKNVVAKTPLLKKISFDRSKVIKTVLIVLGVVLSFALIDLFVQYLNNSYSVAVVNGERIARNDFYQRLEKAYGSQAVSTLIDEQLIQQEASKQGYTASEGDVDNRIKEIESEIGGKDKLDDALEVNGITMEDLRRQVRLDLLVKDVLEPTIDYEDKDVEDFFKQYKDVIYTGQEDVKFEDKKEEVTEYFLNQKIDEAKTAWLSELRKEARIQNNIEQKPSYGFLKVTTNIVNNLLEQAKEEK